MSPNRQNRFPKTGATPEERKIKIGGDPESFDKQHIAWQFHRMDKAHDKWGWEQLHAPQWRRVLQSLESFEGLTWSQIKEAAGGRRRGTNHHSIRINDLSKAARDRIIELRLDQYDKVFSLRLTNTLRIYGIRDERVMRLLWYDPYHSTQGGVCPTTR
jgi:hypothetical protein